MQLCLCSKWYLSEPEVSVATCETEGYIFLNCNRCYEFLVPSLSCPDDFVSLDKIPSRLSPTMAVSGVTGSPSAYCLNVAVQGRRTPSNQVHSFSSWGQVKQKLNVLRMERSLFASSGKTGHLCKMPLICAMDASFGDTAGSNVFPRINVRDPYKRLGISTDASEEEIQGARNFLIQKYGGHKPSVDAIESAHDKIIMQKFQERKRPKLNVDKKIREITQSRYVQLVTSRFQTPSDQFLLKTTVAFLALAALTFLFPTEEGPTLQVAISLFATIYFIHSRLKSKLRAFLYGVGTFIVAWLVGTFLMVSMIPPLYKGPRSLEVMTSVISYVLLWVSSTYLK